MARIAFRRVLRQRWDGPFQGKLVLLAAVHEDDGTVTGEVWAADGPTPRRVESAPGATVDPRRRTVTTAEGVEWSGSAPGCGCQIPKALKGFDPIGART